MKLGYIRVSSKEQNEERQLVKMKALGIEDRFMFIEKESGKHFANRPVYQQMKLTIREGDTLYIDSIDRLGRNYDELKNEWKDLTANLKVDVVALDMEELFDSRKFKAMGDVGALLEDQMLSLLAWVAAAERNKIRSRQREGIELAKAQGKYKGRQPVVYDTRQFARVYKQVLRGSRSNRSAMEELGLKNNTYWKAVKHFQTLSGPFEPKDDTKD